MLISIIVPIYNVSQYIDKGMNQLLALTYNKIEIILVDDGSTDGSSKLIDHWASQYDFVYSLHQKNAGAGAARQNGIDHANGDYIWFYDIDDEIETDLLERSMPYLDGKLDILQFSYDTSDSQYRIKQNCRFEPLEMHSNKEVRDHYVDYILGQNYLNGFVWNKIYRSAFLKNNGIRFQNQKIQQDEIFNLIAYKYVQEMRIIPDILYHYYIYYKGNTRSYYISNRIKIFQEVRDSFLELYDFWNLKDKEMLMYVYKRHINSVIIALNFNLSKSFFSGAKDVKLAVKDTAIQNSLEQMRSLNCNLSGIMNKGYIHALKAKSVKGYVSIFILNVIEDSLKHIIYYLPKRFLPFFK